MSDAITFEHVFYTRDGGEVVRDLHGGAAAGEILLVVGPSASGKSAVARLCAGLIEPHQGRVRIHRGPVGYIPQGSGLISNRSAYENIVLQHRYRSDFISGGEIESAVSALMERFGIAPFRDRLPDTLSEGVRKRVAIVRALAAKPSVLIADNLAHEVDILEGIRTLDAIRRISRETGLTVILFSGHIEPEVRIADRMAVFADGRFDRVGAPDEVLEGDHPWIREISAAESELRKE